MELYVKRKIKDGKLPCHWWSMGKILALSVEGSRFGAKRVL
jgi:hypothetical protein